MAQLTFLFCRGWKLGPRPINPTKANQNPGSHCLVLDFVEVMMHHPTMAQLGFLFCRRGWLQDFDLIAPQIYNSSLGGQDPKPLVVQKIEEYAAKVRGKGFHLDVLDAALFADNHDAMLHVAFDPFPGGEFKFLSCVEYFKEISPTIDLDGSSELIRESPHTWCLVSVNANFDNKALRNHWVAGFFKDQLQPDMWDLLTAREIEKDSIEATKVDAEVKKTWGADWANQNGRHWWNRYCHTIDPSHCGEERRKSYTKNRHEWGLYKIQNQACQTSNTTSTK